MDGEYQNSACGDRGSDGRAPIVGVSERERRLNAIPIKTIHARASASFDGNVALDPSTITAIKIRVNNRTRRRRQLVAFVNPPSERCVQLVCDICKTKQKRYPNKAKKLDNTQPRYRGVNGKEISIEWNDD